MKTKMAFLIIITFLGVLLLFNCINNFMIHPRDNPLDRENPDYKPKDFTSFKFEQANNVSSQIGNDETAVINNNNNTITCSVKYNTDVSFLVPIFTFSGASVKVGNIDQTSGVTGTSFAGSVIYSVYDAEGNKRDYTMTLTIRPNTGKDLGSFRFDKNPVNPGFQVDLKGMYSNNTDASPNERANILVTVPIGSAVNSLIASFEISAGSTAWVSTTAQTSGSTTNNFSSQKLYRIVAADSTDKEYYVDLTTDARFGQCFLSGASFK